MSAKDQPQQQQQSNHKRTLPPKTAQQQNRINEPQNPSRDAFEPFDELNSLKAKYPGLRQTYRAPQQAMTKSTSQGFFPGSKKIRSTSRSKYDLNAYFKINSDKWYSELGEGRQQDQQQNDNQLAAQQQYLASQGIINSDQEDKGKLTKPQQRQFKQQDLHHHSSEADGEVYQMRGTHSNLKDRSTKNLVSIRKTSLNVPGIFVNSCNKLNSSADQHSDISLSACHSEQQINLGNNTNMLTILPRNSSAASNHRNSITNQNNNYGKTTTFINVNNIPVGTSAELPPKDPSNQIKSRHSSFTAVNFKVRKMNQKNVMNQTARKDDKGELQQQQQQLDSFRLTSIQVGQAATIAPQVESFITAGNEMMERKMRNTTNNKATFYSADFQGSSIKNQVGSLEHFDEGKLNDTDPQILLANGPFHAHSKWQDQQGNFEWKDCLVKGFNPSTEKFTIEWVQNQKLKEVSRLNLMYEGENEMIAEERYKAAQQKREQMISFLNLKQQIAESQFREIVLSKPQLHRILGLIYRKDTTKAESTKTAASYPSKQQIITEIFDNYKFDVCKFIIKAAPFISMQEFFSKYFPFDLIWRKNREKGLDGRFEVLIEVIDDIVEDNSNNIADQANNGKNAIRPEDDWFSGSSQFEQFIYVSQVKYSKVITPNNNNSTTPSPMNKANSNNIGGSNNRRNQLQQQQIQQFQQQQTPKMVSRVVSVKSQQFQLYSQFRLQNAVALMRTIRFHPEQRLVLLHQQLPHLLTVLEQISEQQMFNWIPDKSNLKLDAMSELDSIKQDILKSINKIQILFDKVEEILNDTVFGLSKSLGFDSKEVLKLEIHNIIHKQLIILCNQLIQSKLLVCIQNSSSQLINQLQSYDAVLPWGSLTEEELSLLDITRQISRIFARNKLALDPVTQLPTTNTANTTKKISVSKKIYDYLIQITKQEEEQEINKSQEAKGDQKIIKQLQFLFENGRRLTAKQIIQRVIVQQDKTNNITNPTSISTRAVNIPKGIRSIRRASNMEEQQQQSQQEPDDYSISWQWMNDSRIIFTIYQQLCKNCLSDMSHHYRYRNLEKSSSMKPLFTLRVTIGGEDKLLKKKISSIQKSFKLGRLDGARMADVLWRSREQLYSYDDLAMEDMFIEIASRNDNEMSIDEIARGKEIGKSNVTRSRFGWYNLNGFLIGYEPNLDIFEEQLKNVLQTGLDEILKIPRPFNDKRSVLSDDSQAIARNSFSNINSTVDSLLTSSLYSAYATLHMLNRFEFYFLHSDSYEKYIRGMIDSDQLQNAFVERDKIIKDAEFIERRLPDVINAGLFAVSVVEFKAAVKTEIDGKLQLFNTKTQERFTSVLEKSIELHQSVMVQLNTQSISISEYITLIRYLRGDTLETQIEEMRKNKRIASVLFDKCQDQRILITPDMLLKFFNSNAVLLDVAAQVKIKNTQLDKAKQKFEDLHNKEKAATKLKLQELLKKIEQLKMETEYERAFEVAGLSSDITSELNDLENRVQNVQFQEEHLNIIPRDTELNFKQQSLDFRIYDTLWKYTSQWKIKKEEWLRKPLLVQHSGGFNNVDIKEIQQTLEEGNKTLREVEPYFRQYDTRLVPLIETLNTDIGQFERVYELLVQVKHESFKSEHWALIFEVMYKDDKKKVDEMLKCLHSPAFNMQFLLANRALEHLGFVSNLAGEAQEQFKNQEAIDNLKSEFSNIAFETTNFHNIPVIISLKERLAELQYQYFTVGEMLRNKVYHQDDFTDKLSNLEYVVKNSIKILKKLAKVQDKVLIFAPLYRFKKHEPYLKQSSLIYNQLIDDFKKAIRELEKKGMKYFTGIFVLSDGPSSKQQLDTHELFASIENRAEFVRQLVQSMAKSIRYQNPRMAFFSDSKIISLCVAQLNPKDFLSQITTVFPGIKEFIVSENPQEKNMRFYVNKLINTQNEIINLPYSIMYQLEKSDDPPLFTFMNEVEREITEYFKQGIAKNLSQYCQLEYNYVMIWMQLVQSKQESKQQQQLHQQQHNPNTIQSFQLMSLISDISFYHDITAILSTNEELADLDEYSSPQDVRERTSHSSLFKLSEIIKRNLSEFIVFFRQSVKFNESQQSIMQFTQFILQIKNHIAIISRLINSLSFRLDSFDYLALPKISLEFNRKETDSRLLSLAPPLPQQQGQAKSKIPSGAHHANSNSNASEQSSSLKHGGSIQSSISSSKDIYSSIMESQKSMVVVISDEKARNTKEIIAKTTQLTKETISSNPISITSISNKSPFLALTKDPQQEFQVVFMSLNYKYTYGYEINSEIKPFMYSTESSRVFLQLLSAFTVAMGACLRGPSQTGKRQTAKALSGILAKPFFEWSFAEENTDAQVVTQVLTGFATGSYWLYVSHLESADLTAISTMASVLFTLRKAIFQGLTQFPFGEQQAIPFGKSFAIMCSYTNNNSNKCRQFNALPKSLLDTFKTIHFNPPDSSAMISGYLELIGVEQSIALEKTRIFEGIQRFLSSSFDKQQFLRKDTLNYQDIADVKYNYTRNSGISSVISLKSVLRILQNCLVIQSQSRFDLDPLQLVVVEYDLMLRGALTHSAYMLANSLMVNSFQQYARVLQQQQIMVKKQQIQIEGHNITGSEQQAYKTINDSNQSSTLGNNNNNNNISQVQEYSGMGSLKNIPVASIQQQEEQDNNDDTEQPQQSAQSQPQQQLAQTQPSQSLQNSNISQLPGTSNDLAIFSIQYPSLSKHLPIISQFLDTHSLPLSDNFLNFLQPLAPIVLSASNFPVIIYGQPNSHKTLVIRLLANIFAKTESTDFNINYIKLDAITQKSLFGYTQKDTNIISKGLLELLTEGTRAVQELEDKDSKDIRYDLETYFCTESIKGNEQQQQQKGKTNNTNNSNNMNTNNNNSNNLTVLNDLKQKRNNFNNNTARLFPPLTSQDWMVLESSDSMNKDISSIEYLELVLTGFAKRQFHLGSGDILELSNQMQIFFELDSLSALSPSAVSEYSLQYCSLEFFDLTQEFNAWFTNKTNQNPYFQQFASVLKILFSFFFLQYFKEILPLHKDETFLYRVSKKGYLVNFLHYLEIFLNEMRKFDIACGEYDIQNPNIPVISIRRQRRFKRMQNLLLQQQQQQQSQSSLSSLPSQSVVNLSSLKQDNQQIQLTADEKLAYKDEILRPVQTLESIFIFALTYSVGIHFRSEKAYLFNDFILEQIPKYTAFMSANTLLYSNGSIDANQQFLFGHNLLQLMSTDQSNSKSLFGMYYDISNECWCRWRSMDLNDESGFISGEYTANNLDLKEIIRLNPESMQFVGQKIYHSNSLESKQVNPGGIGQQQPQQLMQQNQQDKGWMLCIPEDNNSLYLETTASKTTKYFMQFLVAYQKPTLILARAQNGVSSCVRSKMKDLVELRNYSATYISLNKATSIRRFQKRVEANLVEKNQNHLTSVYETQALVVIDDINLSSNGISALGALRSFWEDHGWFSNAKLRYFSFSLVRMVGIYSYSDYANTNILNPQHTVLPSSLVEKAAILRMPENSSKDLMNIFSAYCDNGKIHNNNNKDTMELLQGGNQPKIQDTSAIKSIAAVMAVAARSFEEELQMVGNIIEGNLSIRKAIEIVSNLNYFETSSRSRNQVMPQLFFRVTVFLLNQYLASEFIHNGIASSNEYSHHHNHHHHHHNYGFQNYEDSLDSSSPLGIGMRKSRNSLISSSSSSSSISQTFNESMVSKDPSNEPIVEAAEALISNIEELSELRKIKLTLQKKVMYFLTFAEEEDEENGDQQENNDKEPKGDEELVIKGPIYTSEKEEFFKDQQGLNQSKPNLSLLHPKRKNSVDSIDQIVSPLAGNTANIRRNPLRQQSLFYELGERNEKDKEQRDQGKIFQYSYDNQVDSQDNKQQLPQQQQQNLQNPPRRNVPKKSFTMEVKLEKIKGNKDAIIGKQQNNVDVAEEIVSEQEVSSEDQNQNSVIEQNKNMLKREQQIISNQTQLNAQDSSKVVRPSKVADEEYKRDKIIGDQENAEILFVEEIQQEIQRNVKITFEDIETLPGQIVKYYARILEDKINGEINGKIDWNDKGLTKGNDGILEAKEGEKKIIQQQDQHNQQQQPAIYVIKPQDGNINNMRITQFEENLTPRSSPTARRKQQPSSILLNRNSLQYFNWCLLTEENVEDNHSGKTDGSDEYCQMQFCLVTASRQKRVQEFLVRNLRDFIMKRQMGYDKLIKKVEGNNNIQKKNENDNQAEEQKQQQQQSYESPQILYNNSLSTIFYHSLKLLHLLQISKQHILLLSQLTQEATFEIVSYNGYILKVPVVEIDVEKDSIGDIKQKIIETIHGVLSRSTQQILFVSMRKEGLLDSWVYQQKQKNNNNNNNIGFVKKSKILMMIHSLVSGSEISSMLSIDELEGLISQNDLRSRFPGVSNHVLLEIISRKIKANLKIIISQEFTVREQPNLSEMHSEFVNLFKEFTKYVMSPVQNTNTDKDETQEDILAELSMELLQTTVPQQEQQILKEFYSVESEISRVFEKCCYSNIRVSLEEQTDMYFLAKHVFKSQIQKKQHDIVEACAYPKILEITKEKQSIFESQLQAVEMDLVKLLQQVKDLEDKLAENLNIQGQLKKIIQDMNNSEINVQQQLNRVLAFEKSQADLAFRTKDLFDKLKVKDEALYMQDIKPEKFLEVVSMNVYVLAFFITTNSFLPECQRIDEAMLEEDIMHAQNKLHFLDMPNLEFYKGKMTEIIQTFQWTKRVLERYEPVDMIQQNMNNITDQNIIQSNINKDNYIRWQIKLIHTVSKDGMLGGCDSSLISLQSGFNVTQQQSIRFIDILVDSIRVKAASWEFPDSSGVLSGQLDTIRATRSKAQEDIIQPEKFCEQLPIEIKELQGQCSANRATIAKKQQGISEFILMSSRANAIFNEFMTKETRGLNDSGFQEKISIVAGLYFLNMRYPKSIHSKLQEILQKNLQEYGLPLEFFNLSSHPYFDVLMHPQLYCQLLCQNVPVNLNTADFLSVMMFFSQYDMFYYPFVIDSSGIYTDYLKATIQQDQLKYEQYTVDQDTQGRIIEALEKGETLIVEDFNEILLEMIMPIINWKQQRMQRLLVYYSKMGDKQNGKAQEGSNSSNLDGMSMMDCFGVNSIRPILEFQNKQIEVHENFRLIMVCNGEKLMFSHSLLNKVFLVTTEFESELRWRQTIEDMLINGFCKDQKKSILQQKLEAFQERERSIKESCLETQKTLQNMETSEDFDAIAFTNYQLETQYYLITLKQSQIDESSGKGDVDGNNIAQDGSGQQIGKIGLFRNIGKSSQKQILLAKKKPKIQQTRKRLSTTKKPDDPLSSKISQVETLISSNYENPLISPQSPPTTPAVMPQEVIRQRLRVRTITQQAALNNQQDVYYQLEDLNRLTDQFKGVLQFFTAIRHMLNKTHESLGEAYKFNERFYQSLIYSAIEDCKKTKNLPQGSVLNNLQFQSQICGYVLNGILSGLKKQDQTLCMLYLSLSYQRINQTLPESEWRIFTAINVTENNNHNNNNPNDGVSQQSDDNGYYNNEIDLFEGRIYKHKWGAISKHLVDFYHLPFNKISQLLSYNENEGKQIFKISKENNNNNNNSKKPKVVEQQQRSSLTNNDQLTLSQHFSSQQGRRVSIRDQIALKYSQQVGQQLQQIQSKHEKQYQHAMEQQYITNKRNSLQGNNNTSNQDGLKGKKHSRNNNPMNNVIQDTVTEVHEKEEQDGLSSNTQSIQDSNKERNISTQQKLQFQQQQSHQGDIPKPSRPSSSVGSNIKSSNVISPTVSSPSNSPDIIPKDSKPISRSRTNSNSSSSSSLQELSNFSVSEALEKIQPQYQTKLGKQSLECFLKMFSHFFTEKSEMKHIINSLITKTTSWIEFMNTSLKIPNYSHFEGRFFPGLVQDIEKKITPLQLLIFAKYFRPDELHRFMQLFIHETFKAVIHQPAPDNCFDNHCESNWQHRPTALYLDNHINHSVYDCLELKMHSMGIQGNVFRLVIGVVPLGQIMNKLNEAAGAGQWVMLENFQVLNNQDQLMLIKKIELELYASTTQKSFKLWMIMNIQQQDGVPARFSENVSDFLKGYLAKCWRVYMDQPMKLADELRMQYHQEIEDYQHLSQDHIQESKEIIEQQSTQQQYKEKDNSQQQQQQQPQKTNTLEISIPKNISHSKQPSRNYQSPVKPSPLEIQQLLHHSNKPIGFIYPRSNNEQLRSRTIQSLVLQESEEISKRFRENKHRYVNLHCFIDTASLVKKNEVYHERIAEFSCKYELGISMALAVLNQREGVVRGGSRINRSREDQMDNLYMTMKDMKSIRDDIMSFLRDYPLDVCDAISKYCQQFMLSKDIQHGFTLSEVKQVLQLFAFTSQEATSKLTVHNNTNISHLIMTGKTPNQPVVSTTTANSLFEYEMYDFHSNIFSTFDEALNVTISSFPQEDPYKLLGMTMNNELELNYQESSGLMRRVLKAEKEQQQQHRESKLQSGLQGILDRFRHISKTEDVPQSQQNPVKNHLKNNKAINEFSMLHVDRLLHYNEQELELMQVIRELLEILDFSFDFKSIQQFNSIPLENNNKNTTQTADNLGQQNISISASSGVALQAWLRQSSNAWKTKDILKFPKEDIAMQSSKKESIQASKLQAIVQGKSNNTSNNNMNDNNNNLNNSSYLSSKKDNNLLNLSQDNNNTSNNQQFICLDDEKYTKPSESSSLHRSIRKHESKFFLAMQQEKEENKQKVSQSFTKIPLKKIIHQVIAKHTLDTAYVLPEIQVKSQESILKVLVLNEAVTAHRLVEQIRQDLHVVLNHMTGRRKSTKALELIENLLDDQVPKTWRGELQAESMHLYDFLKGFLIRHEYLNTVINATGKNNAKDQGEDNKVGKTLMNSQIQQQQRSLGEICPVLQLNKLFSPLKFILSMQLHYCLKNQCKINEVKMYLRRQLRLDDKQPAENGFIISGISVKNARIDLDTLQLEDARIREFESTLPPFHLFCAQKTTYRSEIYHIHDYQYESNVALELVSSSSSKPSSDRENDYFYQQRYPLEQAYQHESRRYTESQRIKPRVMDTKASVTVQQEESQRVIQEELQKIAKKEKDRLIDFDKATSVQGNFMYTVRLQLRDSSKNGNNGAMDMPFYLYLLSRKPQAYWNQKQAYLHTSTVDS